MGEHISFGGGLVFEQRQRKRVGPESSKTGLEQRGSKTPLKRLSLPADRDDLIALYTFGQPSVTGINSLRILREY